MLISVKGAGVGSVGGNVDFGDPNVGAEPFGKAFAIAQGSVGERGAVYARRQEDRPVGQALPIFNVTGNPPYPILNGSKVSDESENPSIVTDEPTPITLPDSADPIVVVEPNPIIPTTTATRGDLPNLPTGSNFPNLFDESHPPSAFALTLFSLFGEGHTERADLRPLGPDVPSGASPPALNGTDWVNPILTALQRPLGEEVVVDGFDVQVPAEWKGHYQDQKFKALVRRLKELHQEAWQESGGVVGGPADLGTDGKGVVYEGYIGGSLKVRSVGLEVRADLKRVGWVEWNPLAG